MKVTWLALPVLAVLCVGASLVYAGRGAQDDTADIVAIDQLWSSYAHKLDAADAGGVADLFTPNGGYVLMSIDSRTLRLKPMGYSPSIAGDGTSGIPGGGCKALGHKAIVNFLTNIGLGNNHTRYPRDHHMIANKWIELHGNTARMQADWMIVTGRDFGAGQTGPALKDSGRYDVTFVRTDRGWKVNEERVIFDGDMPTYPCRN